MLLSIAKENGKLYIAKPDFQMLAWAFLAIARYNNNNDIVKKRYLVIEAG